MYVLFIDYLLKITHTKSNKHNTNNYNNNNKKKNNKTELENRVTVTKEKYLPCHVSL